MTRRDRRKLAPAAQTSPASPAAARAVAPISRRRLWLLRISLAFLGPLLFLLLCEAALRVVGYGYPTGFLLPAVVNDSEAWVPNALVGRRFFGANYERKPAIFAIPREKPADAVRIFVFGESAAFGDPQPDFGLPRMLQALLHGRYPHTRFEVVNAAMTGINSHTVRAIADDCTVADGDLWVIYMGNNEVVGPFGAGTVFGPQAPGAAIIRGSLAIKSTRFGQLLSTLEQALHPTPASKSQWGGMLMFIENQVRSDDPRMARVYQHFAANLRHILAAAKSANVGVVVSTVAVNLRDCAPFASLHRPDLTKPQLKKWQAAFRRGMAEQKAGRHPEAIAHFGSAAELDDTYADLSFALAGSLLADGDREGAARLFARARDQDVLRFRCDAKLNAVIREIGAEQPGDRLRLVDAEKTFASAAADGVSGSDDFYEHVHLTFAGNYLLARTVVDQLDALLPERVRRDADEASDWLTVDECKDRLAWTSWPRLLALNDIIGRLADPPFTSQANHAAQLAALERRAEELRPRVADDAQHADALYAAALAAAPDDAALYAQLCQLHSQGGAAKAAIADARRATELLPTCVDYWLLLGAALATDQQFAKAADAYKQALRVDEENSFALLNLARIYAQLDRSDDAMAAYRRTIAANPHAGPAYLELGRLQEARGEFSEAEKNFRLALENRVRRPQDLVQLALLCQDRGWMNEAAQNYLDAAALSPGDAGLRISAGQSLAALKKHAAAQEQFRRALEIAPDMGEVHFLLAVELGSDNQLEEAIVHFREAVRRLPQIVEARINLAIALKRSGNTDEALEQFQKVLEQSPNHPVATRQIQSLTGAKP